jgi:hypothetical protein
MRVAKIVDHDVKCGEEGVLKSSMGVGSFPFGIGEQADSSSWAPSSQIFAR